MLTPQLATATRECRKAQQGADPRHNTLQPNDVYAIIRTVRSSSRARYLRLPWRPEKGLRDAPKAAAKEVGRGTAK